MRYPLRILYILVLLSCMLSVQHNAVTATSHITLTMWHIEDSKTMDALGIQKIFDEWASDNAPGITLTLVAKQVDDLEYLTLNSDSLPDLLWTVADHISPFVAQGRIQALNDMIDTSLYLPALVSMARSNDKIYALPIQAANPILLLYNKRFVKQAPQTFNELISIAQSLQLNAPEDFVPFAYDQEDSYWIFPIAHAFGASAFSTDGKALQLNTEAWVQTYQFIYDLKFKAKIEPLICLYVCADRRFRTEKTAMILNGDWVLRGTDNYLNLLGDNLGVAVLPAVGDDPLQKLPTSFVGGRFLMITVDVPADRLRIARAFAHFLATDRQAALSWTVPHNRLPALLAALNDEQIIGNERLAPVRDSLLRGIALPTTHDMTCAFSGVTQALRKLINDSTTPTEAPAMAQQAAEECIAQR